MFRQFRHLLVSAAQKLCCGLSSCVNVCPFTEEDFPHQSKCSTRLRNNSIVTFIPLCFKAVGKIQTVHIERAIYISWHGCLFSFKYICRRRFLWSCLTVSAPIKPHPTRQIPKKKTITIHNIFGNQNKHTCTELCSLALSPEPGAIFVRGPLMLGQHGRLSSAIKEGKPGLVGVRGCSRLSWRHGCSSTCYVG